MNNVDIDLGSPFQGARIEKLHGEGGLCPLRVAAGMG